MAAYAIFVIVFVKIFLVVAAQNNYCKSDNKDCVVFTQCAEAMKLVNTRKFEPKVIELFQSSICGNSGRGDCILCSKIKLDEKTVSKPECQLPTLEECGLATDAPKIIHGEIAELDDFPWIALIKYKNATGHIAYRCHGTLINSRYVVTAKHCLQLSEADKKKKGIIQSIVLGEYNTSSARDCLDANYCADPIQEFSMDAFQVCPETGRNHNDIGVIRLNGTAKFSEFVRPICLPMNFSSISNDEKLWISGWGRTENKTASNVKRKATIQGLTSDECYQRTYLTPDASEICAGSDRGRDSCHGDSGGPLMATRIYNQEQNTFLVGVVSWGRRCGATAAIYTNVFKFRGWIIQTVKNMEGCTN